MLYNDIFIAGRILFSLFVAGRIIIVLFIAGRIIFVLFVAGRIIFILFIAGRIISGMLSDQPWADCLLIHNLALIIAGLATMCVPFLTNFPLLAAYCVIFGL